MRPGTVGLRDSEVLRRSEREIAADEFVFGGVDKDEKIKISLLKRNLLNTASAENETKLPM